MTEEIVPGIYQLKLPIPMQDSTLNHVCAYILRGVEGYTLVDGGWNTPESFAALEKQLAGIGAKVKDISQILVTHSHPDHFGQAGRIRELSGAEIAMNRTESEFVVPRYIEMEKLLEESARLLFRNGMPPAEVDKIRDATLGLENYVIPAKPDKFLSGGDTISNGVFTFRVMLSPGHSAGHICFYEADRKILISGDHVLPRITSNVGFHPQSGPDPLGRYLASLRELRELEIEMVLPGHEAPFTTLKKRIDGIIRHHDERNGEIMEELSRGPKTAFQLVGCLTWGVSGTWREMPDFHKRLAVFETLAHLEYLAAEGRLEKSGEEGIIYYRQN